MPRSFPGSGLLPHLLVQTGREKLESRAYSRLRHTCRGIWWSHRIRCWPHERNRWFIRLEMALHPRRHPVLRLLAPGLLFPARLSRNSELAFRERTRNSGATPQDSRFPRPRLPRDLEGRLCHIDGLAALRSLCHLYRHFRSFLQSLVVRTYHRCGPWIHVASCKLDDGAALCCRVRRHVDGRMVRRPL